MIRRARLPSTTGRAKRSSPAAVEAMAYATATAASTRGSTGDCRARTPIGISSAAAANM